MASTENFYSGNSYSLDPDYGNFVGYRVPVSEIGIATDPRVANQVNEASKKLNFGLKKIEVGAIQPDVFESIPKQYFKEMNRLLKLTGAEASMHGPMIDASGYTGKGGWSEEQRKSAERQMLDAVEKGHEIDPKGNIPITFHSTASEIPGTEFTIEKEDGKRIKVPTKMIVINRDTYQPQLIKGEERFYPTEVGAKVIAGEKVKAEKTNVKKELEVLNQSDWHNQLSQILMYKNQGDEIMEKHFEPIAPIIKQLQEGKLKEEDLKEMNPKVLEAFNRVRSAQEYYQNSRLTLNGMFNKAYKYAETEKDKEKLKELAKKFKNALGAEGKYQYKVVGDALQELATGLQEHNPNLYKPIEEFRIEKAAETFGAVAFKAYDKFGSSAPIISIENPPAGGGLSTGEELRDLVKASREKFVKKAVEEGVSKSTAESAAKKLIGVTWDVGHINMLRRYGFEKEDLINEAKAVAPMVKHVHLSDNFGFEHTELPMGMGNVPIKEILKQLGKEGFKGKKIIEAGNWWQHFSPQGQQQNTPIGPTLEAFGSPIGPTAMAGPYWNQVIGTEGAYFGGYGTMLPEQHFNRYGAGWEQLPVELGGQVQGKRDRFSGAPMD